jgi:hypothetical protein
VREVERLGHVTRTDRGVPRHVRAEPKIVDRLVHHDPGRHPPAVVIDDAFDRPEQHVACVLLAQCPEVGLRPPFTEPFVPDQVRAEHEHALLPGEPDDPVAVAEIELCIRRRPEAPPQEVVLREQHRRLPCEQAAVLRVRELPRRRGRAEDETASERDLPQRLATTAVVERRTFHRLRLGAQRRCRSDAAALCRRARSQRGRARADQEPASRQHPSRAHV